MDLILNLKNWFIESIKELKDEDDFEKLEDAIDKDGKIYTCKD